MKEASLDRGSVTAKLDDELKLADTLKQHQSFIEEGLMEAKKQKEELEERSGENNMKLWQVLIQRVQYLLV